MFRLNRSHQSRVFERSLKFRQETLLCSSVFLILCVYGGGGQVPLKHPFWAQGGMRQQLPESQNMQLPRKEVVGRSARTGGQRPAALLSCDKEARSAWQHGGWFSQLPMLWSQKFEDTIFEGEKKGNISRPTIMARGNHHKADRVQQDKFLSILKVNLKRIELCFLRWGSLAILSFWRAFWIVK